MGLRGETQKSKLLKPVLFFYRRNNMFAKKWTICLALMLSGCAVTSPVVREMVSLRPLHEGMSRQDVQARLTEKVTTGYDLTEKKDAVIPIVLKNPYREETLKIANKTYQIDYYFTSIKKQDGMISNDELTPLVFENDRLIGQGWAFLDQLKKKIPSAT